MAILERVIGIRRSVAAARALRARLDGAQAALIHAARDAPR
jgi:hypothetical protein